MSNSGVMNICLAVGPIVARPIRIGYLKKNVKFLNRTLKDLLIFEAMQMNPSAVIKQEQITGNGWR